MMHVSAGNTIAQLIPQHESVTRVRIELKHPTVTEVSGMFILRDPDGNPACSIKTGEPFVYFTPEMAHRAAKALSKERKTVYQVVRV